MYIKSNAIEYWTASVWVVLVIVFEFDDVHLSA